MLNFGLVIYLFCIRKNAAQKLMNPPEIIRLLLFLFYGIIRPCLLSETTISCKIFETNSSFYVK